MLLAAELMHRRLPLQRQIRRLILGVCCLAVLTLTMRGAAETPAASAPESTPESAARPYADPLQARLQPLTRLGVDRWHQTGYRGRGVKIAILDTGFRGYRAHLDRALPAQVTPKSFRSDGNLEAKDSQHGILCAEVLHSLAPEAELLLANWEPDRSDQFLDAV